MKDLQGLQSKLHLVALVVLVQLGILFAVVIGAVIGRYI